MDKKDQDYFFKIINATYKLLDFFPDNEPLKFKAKERTLGVMENLTLVVQADGWTSLQKEKASANLLDDVEILERYLELGKHQGWVGGINLLILLKEYNNLKKHIRPPAGTIKKNLQAAALSGQIPSDQKHLVVQEKTKKEDSQALRNTPVKSLATLERPIDIQKEEQLSERQQKIIAIIASRGKAQVSDIIKEIPDITKRTIRRDLDDLLKKSKISRTGEWNEVSYQII